MPIAGGVYVVYRTVTTEPSFRDVGTGGRFKGKDPNVPADLLRAKWIDGCSVLYIGKATSLKKRLSQYRRFGEGAAIGHWGGRYIWQCTDVDDYVVAWKATEGDPREEEKRLLSRFQTEYARLPFANLAN